jgi:N-acetylglutamate synthase-like GNAT family acetyltransferase
MATMHVRRAEPRDALAVEQLYRELVPGDRNISVAPERLALLERDAANHLLVLEREGAVCGTAFLTICLDSMYGFAPYGVLENVVVSPALRGCGAGRALLAEAERIGREQRCTKLMLLSSAARSDAHAFFAHLGYDGERKRGFVKYLNRAAPL